MIVEKDRQHVMESRATNVIESAINLINEMHKHYDEETAGDLERRLLNSIRNQDTKRFVRGIRRVNESKCASKK
jgi:phosphopantetheine adenylyltransferase|tara:strand:+ start:176 stop:397 length:222 start_codon:yes stop_codon:yes gene_type:complete